MSKSTIWHSAPREFPMHPLAELPDSLPAGFEDSSWHNDINPSARMVTPTCRI